MNVCAEVQRQSKCRGGDGRCARQVCAYYTAMVRIMHVHCTTIVAVVVIQATRYRRSVDDDDEDDASPRRRSPSVVSGGPVLRAAAVTRITFILYTLLGIRARCTLENITGLTICFPRPPYLILTRLYIIFFTPRRAPHTAPAHLLPPLARPPARPPGTYV